MGAGTISDKKALDNSAFRPGIIYPSELADKSGILAPSHSPAQIYVRGFEQSHFQPKTDSKKPLFSDWQLEAITVLLGCILDIAVEILNLPGLG